MKRKSGIVLALLLVITVTPAFAEGRKIVKERPPQYPEMARKFSLHGTVTVQLTVSPAGRVTDAKVTGGHPILAQSALNAVETWVFEPAAGATTETVKVDFK